MTQTIVVFAVLALVFLILPAILKKLTGRDFIELLVGRPLFKKQRGSGPKNGDPGLKDAGGADAKADAKKEKNSSKADILHAVSEVVNFARRNQFEAIVPGALKLDELETMLPVILVMRSGVVGINMFGYGGAVNAKRIDETWTQTMNGESRQIPSPVMVSEKQKQVLEQILKRVGYGKVSVSMINVFTSRSVTITGPGAADVIHTRSLTGELGKSRYMRTNDVDVKAVGGALAKLRQAKQKQA